MEKNDKNANNTKKIYVHLQLLGLQFFLESKEFDLFCEENELEEVRDKIITSLHQEYGLPKRINRILTTSGKIRIDLNNFPEELVKPFLKVFLNEIYCKETERFVEIIVSFLTYYSRHNRDIRDGKPTPIDNELMRAIGYDLLDMDYAEPDVAMYFHMAGYDLETLLSLNDPMPVKIQNGSNDIPKKNIHNSSISKKVFIVHGHEEKIKNDVEEFLQSIGLEPIILHKQADLGKTIIEKVEHYSDVGFAIIVLTADDVGCKKVQWGNYSITGLAKKQQHLLPEIIQKHQDSETLKILRPRARQNVIFEFGFFIGKLGRNRVAALCEEGIERHSDIDGLLFTPLDKRGEWRKKVAKEINAAGIKIEEKYL